VVARVKEDYLSYARRILDYYDVDFPNRITQEFHFNAQQLGGWVGHLVNAYAQMYKITCDVKYANRARELLLYWSRYPAFNPPGEKTKLSVGPFIGCMLVGGLKILRDNGFVTREEEAPLWSCIYDMVNSLVDPYVKQGKEKVLERSHAWNHPTMDMTYAMETAQIFPDHPDASKWMEWGKLLLDQSFNKPTVEDSTGYTSVWFIHTIRAAEFLGLTQGFYAYPYTRYCFQYLRDLIMPTGQMPDFGDAAFGDWARNVALYEKAASVYRDGSYKTAAHRLFQFMAPYGPVFGGETNYVPSEDFWDWSRKVSMEERAAGGWYAQVAGPPDPRESFGPDHVMMERAWRIAEETSFLILAYLWADDDVAEEPIPARSQLYERRAILRDSWNQEDSYLLFGLEDWTRVHGQGEGNALDFLSKGDSVLLYETGYNWRQARYHNTVIFKEGVSNDPFNYLWEPESPLFMLKVRPPERRAKVPIFEPMHNAVFLRSRLDQFQRTLVKAGEAVYVFDYLDVRGDYSAACLYHTQRVVERGENQFRTRLENFFYCSHVLSFANRGDGELLVVFPNAETTGVSKEVRAYTDEYAVYQLLTGSFPEGLAFSSILFPVKRVEPRPYLGIENLVPKSDGRDVYPHADGVKVSLGEEQVYACSRNTGLETVEYGDVASDAEVLYLKVKKVGVQVSAVNVSTIRFKGETILAAGEKKGRFESAP